MVHRGDSGIDEGDASVHIPKFDLPHSVYMSEEAKLAFSNMREYIAKFDLTSISRFRETTDRYYWGPLLTAAQLHYPVSIEDTRIADVSVSIVMPKNGVEKDDEDKVLINLHGGSFELGCGGLGGKVESVPIAAVTGYKVISIDYRQSPEHAFPSASEDIEAVYKVLLKSYGPENIGIYGCSAGAILTCQSIAWFLKKKTPLPGAIGLFCAGADPRYAGDSRFIASRECGDSPIPPAGENPPGLLPGYKTYMQHVDLADPLVTPALSPEVLGRFPPTLLISGTRAYDLSSAAYTHTQLVKLGVDANLYIWDGMWHGFHYDVKLPESREAFDIIAKFFRKNLLAEGSI